MPCWRKHLLSVRPGPLKRTLILGESEPLAEQNVRWRGLPHAMKILKRLPAWELSHVTFKVLPCLRITISIRINLGRSKVQVFCLYLAKLNHPTMWEIFLSQLFNNVQFRKIITIREFILKRKHLEGVAFWINNKQALYKQNLLLISAKCYCRNRFNLKIITNILKSHLILWKHIRQLSAAITWSPTKHLTILFNYTC